MVKKNFSIKINVPKERVWDVLWNDNTYRQWTAPFCEGSYAVTDWNEGSRVQFLSPSGDGMFSVIAKKIPNEFMSFKHLGEIKKGMEQPETEATKKWSGSTENYTLKDEGGKTELIVELDSTEEFENFFNEAFPKALEKVKELAEKN